MNNDISINDFDFNLICEYFSNVERQGPGSKEATIKALDFLDGVDAHSKIADLGCGTGGQTITLAQNTSAHITALDLFPLFIEKLKFQTDKLKLSDRIQGIIGSMDNLPFKEEEFDVIWSEGAIYNIGFQRGLRDWRKFLKTGGYIAVSEASWLTNNRPEEIEHFWIEAYPEMDTIANKVAQMQTEGYVPIATFILPEYCWTNNFYIPQIQTQKLFLKSHAGNKTAEDLVKNMRHEAELYSKYKQYYGYVFYIGRKI